jgi:NCS1 family nucleobase:cation symporter-1
MGAIGGVLIADYWVVRNCTLATADLFDLNGRYRYTNGINWRAMIALALAIVPVVPGFVRAAATPGGQVANPTLLDSLYTYAWFVTFALSFVIYLALMKADQRTANRSE